MLIVSENNFLQDKPTRLFLILGGFFITNALVAEFIGIKIFSLEQVLGIASMDWTLFGVTGLGFDLTAGVLLWPVVFVMTDIVNEYYGKRGVRFLSYGAVALILFAFFILYLAIQLPPNEWWQYESGLLGGIAAGQVRDMQLAFAKVMGQGGWIIIGSLIAFLVGQFLDVLVFQKIKRATGESKIWLRATGSTLVSQFVDSFVVLIVAFYIGAEWDLTRVVAIGLVNYVFKFIVAIGLTPIIYLAHYIIDSYLGAEAYQMKQEALLS